ncbi:lytic transglycosylase domain-containing protein [Kineococcus sp. NBC_00420]|uniref:lytic transglycosylase domain-containing protein n=1 Tax=Kineococcus sp. NBC_00420 TaxID=2903564 RepID=UPI002E25214E
MNRRSLSALVLVLGLGAGGLAGANPALADPGTAAQARQEAAAAAQAVQRAGERVTAAQEALVRQRSDVASAVSSSIGAQVQADHEERAAATARSRTAQRVRSIYIDGGVVGGAGRGLALLTSLTHGADPTVALAGLSAARRVDDAVDAAARTRAASAREDAQQADGGAVAAVAGLRDVAAQVSAMTDALTGAQQRLEALTAEAASLQAAEDAAAALAAAQARAAALNAAATSSAEGVHARTVPADYDDLYRHAAATCAGMRPELLAAVGQVESGHGVNVGPSSAGAQGPMQFMPATFASYGVDGDDDGSIDVQDPADAVFSAAKYLCANGGGQGRDGEAGALFRYNHADWYVAMVQRIADELTGSASLTSP